MFIIILTIVTQIIIPAILGQELFWLFKRKKSINYDEDVKVTSLDELHQETKQTVNQYNKTKKKIDKAAKKIDDIKSNIIID